MDFAPATLQKPTFSRRSMVCRRWWIMQFSSSIITTKQLLPKASSKSRKGCHRTIPLLFSSSWARRWDEKGQVTGMSVLQRNSRPPARLERYFTSSSFWPSRQARLLGSGWFFSLFMLLFCSSPFELKISLSIQSKHQIFEAVLRLISGKRRYSGNYSYKIYGNINSQFRFPNACWLS